MELALAAVFPILHFSYGVGFLRGIYDHLLTQGVPAAARRRSHGSGAGATAWEGRVTDSIRVLMVTSDWLWNSWGGPAVFIARQADFLRREGVEVDLFPFRGSRRPANYAAAWREVQRRLEHGSYDLVHAQFGQSGLTALPKRVPLVVTFRGDDLEGIIGESGRYIPAGWLLRLLSRTVARQADAAIVVSEHMKRHLPRSVDAHVLPSGLDLDLFRPEPQDQARGPPGASAGSKAGCCSSATRSWRASDTPWRRRR